MSTASEVSERREHTRHRVFRVGVRVASPDAFRAGTLRDLSAGGLFVRSRRPLPPRTRVVVELAVGAGHPMMLPGEVVRTELEGFAVRFDATLGIHPARLGELLKEANRAVDHTDPEALRAELARVKGEAEAYEQALTTARDAELEAVQRAETAEFERTLLAQHAHELSAKLAAAEKERAQVTALLSVAQHRLQGLEQHHHERAPNDEATALNARLTAEVARLRAELAQHSEQAMREEVRSLHEQLDDERLKTMALQRALERFMAMGGTLKREGEAPPGPAQ